MSEAVQLVDFPVLRTAGEEHSAIFGAMNNLMVLPEAVKQRLRLFSDDQVLQMRQYAREWGGQAALLECACDAEIKRRDRLRGGRGRRDTDGIGRVATAEEYAREAGTSVATVYRNAHIHETFFDPERNDEETILSAENSFLLLGEKQFLTVALSAPDPHAALEEMATKKAANRFYSTRDAGDDVDRIKYEAKQQRMQDQRTIRPLGPGDYPVVYADPPWKYEQNTTNPGRAIERQYQTMDLDEICALPVATWAAHDAILFLWATNPKLEEAFAVMRAWGFSYRTNMAWVKDRIGMGHWVRQQHELLLIGRRGTFPTPPDDAMPPSVLMAPRREHSQKPDEMYDIIERMYPDLPYLEMFARRTRPGWTPWGNEVP